MHEILKKEDYEESNCLLCDKKEGNDNQRMIPQQRIISKLDELMGKKDFNNAEKLLLYWLQEAKSSNDKQGEFFLYNEMMGYYRKVLKKDEAYAATNKGLMMIEELNYTNSISGATCYTNGATVYTSFKDFQKALPLFEKARIIYENNKTNNEYKLAGLYNNMAISLIALKEYQKADNYFNLALSLLKEIDHAKLEIALIYLNKIDILLSRDKNNIDEDIVNDYLSKAKDYLDDESVMRDTYYSFMADKCVSVYEYFGWFRYVKILKERIKEIDERARAS